MIDKDLFDFLTEMGYTDIILVPSKGVCAIMDFIFTTGVIYNIDYSGYKGRYCFKTKDEAKNALKSWNGEEDIPGNWIKHKGEKEYSNPNYV